MIGKDIALHLRQESKRTDVSADIIRTLSAAYAEISRLRRERDELKHSESVRRQKMLSDITLCVEAGGVGDGRLEQLFYDLARKEVDDLVIRDSAVNMSYQYIANKYRGALKKLAESETVFVGDNDHGDAVPTNGVVKHGMTQARWDLLMQHTYDKPTQEKLTEAELTAGWHYCNDWDGLLINARDIEFDHCQCDYMQKFRKE